MGYPVPAIGNFTEVGDGGGTTSLTTSAITTRAGAGLYLVVIVDTAINITNITDSKGNAYIPYQLGIQRDTDNGGRMRRYFIPHHKAKTGSSHTVTVTTSGSSFHTLIFVEVLNRPILALNQSSDAVDTTDPFTPPSLTSLYPDMLFIAAIMSQGTETGFTAGGSFTEIVESIDAGSWHGAASSRTLTAIGSVQASWTGILGVFNPVCQDGFIYDVPAGPPMPPVDWYAGECCNDGFVIPTLLNADDGWF